MGQSIGKRVVFLHAKVGRFDECSVTYAPRNTKRRNRKRSRRTLRQILRVDVTSQKTVRFLRCRMVSRCGDE
jgi:hypothetical protein